jgi:hypothetical protein
MVESRTGYLALTALATFPVLAYVISKRWSSSFGSRLAQAVLACLLTVVAYVGTFAYANDSLRDFRNPQVPFSLALTGNIILWSVCFGAWLFALRFLVLCFRRR